MSGICLFGGTFDPPHLGHLRLLQTAVSAVAPERVIVIPDRLPPHKISDRLASPQLRLEMCRLTFGEIGGAEISGWETDREGKSYSIYTVRHFRELYPDGKLWFVMGSDMLLYFEKWYCWEELLRLCTPLCLARCSGDARAAREQAKRLCEITGIPDAAVVAEAPPIEISSTEIRKAVALGGDVSRFVEPRTLALIKEKGLYKDWVSKNVNYK